MKTVITYHAIERAIDRWGICPDEAEDKICEVLEKGAILKEQTSRGDQYRYIGELLSP